MKRSTAISDKARESYCIFDHSKRCHDGEVQLKGKEADSEAASVEDSNEGEADGERADSEAASVENSNGGEAEDEGADSEAASVVHSDRGEADGDLSSNKLSPSNPRIAFKVLVDKLSTRPESFDAISVFQEPIRYAIFRPFETIQSFDAGKTKYYVSPLVN